MAQEPTAGDAAPTTGPSPAFSSPSTRRGLFTLVGLMLVGYGALVLIGVLPHDSLPAGFASVAAGAVVLAWTAWRTSQRIRVLGDAPVDRTRSRAVGILGCICTGGVLGYALARPNGLGGPEWALLAYGVLLMAASTGLGRSIGIGNARLKVSTLVGWSFPLVLAPLALFALNAALSDGSASAAAAPVVEALVVTPTVFVLRLLGTPVQQLGSSMILATPRGSLTLDVGLVCAGLYPSVLFIGLVALHGWQRRLRPPEMAAILAIGMVVLWVLNVLRLVALTHIGIRWGMDALQTAHANLGWILFTAFTAAFWQVVLRRARGQDPDSPVLPLTPPTPARNGVPDSATAGPGGR